MGFRVSFGFRVFGVRVQGLGVLLGIHIHIYIYIYVYIYIYMYICIWRFRVCDLRIKGEATFPVCVQGFNEAVLEQ